MLLWLSSVVTLTSCRQRDLRSSLCRLVDRLAVLPNQVRRPSFAAVSSHTILPFHLRSPTFFLFSKDMRSSHHSLNHSGPDFAVDTTVDALAYDSTNDRLYFSSTIGPSVPPYACCCVFMNVRRMKRTRTHTYTDTRSATFFLFFFLFLFFLSFFFFSFFSFWSLHGQTRFSTSC
jgi:hypothetical protein